VSAVHHDKHANGRVQNAALILLFAVYIVSNYRLMSPALLLIVLLCLASLVGVYVTRERNYVVADGQFVFDVQTKLTAIAVVSIGLLYLTGNLFTLQLPVFIGGIRECNRKSYHIYCGIDTAQYSASACLTVIRQPGY
jgi:hypothetical protein